MSKEMTGELPLGLQGLQSLMSGEGALPAGLEGKMMDGSPDEAGGEAGSAMAGDTSAFESVVNLTAVHRYCIPGIWNRVRMDTWPENYCVLEFKRGSKVHLELTGEGA